MNRFIILLLLMNIHSVYAQKVAFEYTLGYGSYQLHDVEEFQRKMVNSIPIALTKNSFFPNYWIHSGTVGYISGQHYPGVNLSFLSTGSRMTTADYSGSYELDLILRGIRLGGFYRYYINSIDINKSPHFFVQISSGVLFSHMDIKEKLNVGRYTNNERLHIYSKGTYVEPSVGISHFFTNWLSSSFLCGYEFDFGGTLKHEGQELQPKVKMKWNGIRTYLTVSVYL